MFFITKIRKKCEKVHFFCVNLQYRIHTFLVVEALQQIQEPIKQDLERFNKMFQETMHHQNPILNVALSHLAQRRGKQMRPIMVFLSARGCMKPNMEMPETVMHAALALEIMHTASLVHDDVVDESDQRRGQKSVNKLFDNQTAVLVGDFLLSKALHHASLVGDLRMTDKISTLGQTLADGELLQMANIDRSDFEESIYYEIIRKKTASLFSTCAEVGAIFGGDNAGYADIMKRFGMLTGICFQLRDDILDYDKENEMGKPAGNDMQEGKLTLPVLFAARRNPEAARLSMLVRQHKTNTEDIEKLISLTVEEGGIVYAEKVMDDFSLMAGGLLENVENRQIATTLQLYLNFVARRNI